MLEWFMRFVYLGLVDLTSNYGLSLILLSILSSLAIVPLTKLVSKYSKREAKIQKIIKPQLNKIKAESSGKERYDRTLNLYKRYSYHPILSLRLILPFMVQLPFLIGAYVMLTRLEAIKGVSFLFIKNLGAADALLFGLNLLPVLMTIFNITTALLTEEFSFKEKVQAFIVAFLFLLLLYNSPAALLIYWTTNNFILFVTTFVKVLLKTQSKVFYE